VEYERLDELSKAYVNLADASMNAEAIFATDDFFAAKERMLDPAEPVWIEGKYDAHGKWMDGWESRRKREHGHDYCIVRLAGAGSIKAIDIDTRYFTGNYPPVASVEACCLESDPDENTEWLEIISPSPLLGDHHNLFEIKAEQSWTHLRLNIFPDGGVARLRVFGEIHQDEINA
jgi:allantoicase